MKAFFGLLVWILLISAAVKYNLETQWAFCSPFLVAALILDDGEI